MELYPGITLTQHGERYSINLEVMTNHGKGLVSFDLVKSMPEIQDAINKRCAEIEATPQADWEGTCEQLNARIGILESEVKAKQMTISAMNDNYLSQEKVIAQKNQLIKELQAKQSGGLFGWPRR